MDQFEYKVVMLHSGKAGLGMGRSLEKQLQALGDSGWNLVFVVARRYRGDRWVFKRRVV